uniref:Uncharacterized protein n=2 Tax=Meloidogyne TaxID=189290 RepID=A0A6V7VMA6_MELEN|nr:unnamed protein product [Meloidogyne enterolobii]
MAIKNVFKNAKYLLIILFYLINYCNSKPIEKNKQNIVYSVLRLRAQNETQLNFLMNEFINNSVKLDFWKEPSNIGEDTHVMVAKGPILNDFLNRLNKYNLNIQIMIEDVNELIKKRQKEIEENKEEEEEEGKKKEDITNFRRQRDDPFINSSPRLKKATNLGRFSLGKYKSFADIIHYLNALAVNYPNRVTVQPIGSTHEGRQIPLIKIGTNNNLIGKPAIWIDGGIHAREWVSPAVVLFMIDQLVIGYDTQPLIKQFVDQLDWFIVPLLNPDGYEYSRSSSDPEIRLWRKNRSPTQCTQINTGLFTPPNTQCCQGVDLNRNFDWFFGQVGSSSDPCSEIFAGNFAFSEPETQSVRDFISQQQGRIKTFMTFHSYSQILMYPFGHSLRTYPQDVQELSNVALRAAQALQSTYGTKYTVGTGADTLSMKNWLLCSYPASGGSEDWAKGRMGVKFSFLFELRPEDSVYDGFLLPESQIVPTARETWEAVKVIGTSTIKQFQQPQQQQIFNGIQTTNNRAKRVCRDTDSLCLYWTQQSSSTCQQWPAMKERCSRSCNFCSVEEEN